MTPREALRTYWGYDDFRPGQKAVIDAALEGRDVLVVMPTGGGKSICYQVPTMCQEGLCLVISPLIALMQDQVGDLQRRDIRADVIHSALSYREIDRILDNARFGGLKFLFVSPERLRTELFVARFRRMPVTLIAVDEAHCIVQWGFDFRPSYRFIGALRAERPEIPMMALTASATPAVQQTITENLGFEQRHFPSISSVLRPNLSFRVVYTEDKRRRLLEILRDHPGSCIIYMTSRRKTQEWADFLNQNGVKVSAYHAGLSHEVRSHRQSQWMQNDVSVMVATSAFGMGIDKADVRLVVHVDVPDSLEAYYQEAGRAGRDGHRASAYILHNQADIRTNERLIQLKYPDRSTIRSFYRSLNVHFGLAVGSLPMESFDLDVSELARAAQVPKRQCLYLLKTLEDSEWIGLSPAVFQPSRVHCAISRNRLFEQLKGREDAEKVMRQMLRSYTGLFSEAVRIRESDIARQSGHSESAVHQILSTLDKSGLIEYTPVKDKAQIAFLKARVPSRDFTIDMHGYRQRYQAARARLDAMKQYLTTEDCRQAIFLGYFSSDDKAYTCGICDRCMPKQIASKADDETRIQAIRDFLAQHPTSTLHDVVASWPSEHRTSILHLLQKLESDKRIRVLPDRLEWCE